MVNAWIGFSNNGRRTFKSNGSPISCINFNRIGPPKTDPTNKNPILVRSCVTPNPVNRPNCLIRSGLNDRPSLNNKNKIPRSPSSISSVSFVNISIPYGPMAHPTSKKPKTGGIFNTLQVGTTTTLATKNKKKSFPNDVAVADADVDVDTASAAPTAKEEDDGDNEVEIEVKADERDVWRLVSIVVVSGAVVDVIIEVVICNDAGSNIWRLLLLLLIPPFLLR
mmetsp:Transcript_26366/g.62744  ORF Transcript_26366/g.62744 Transcript_26366/m.62744 type:complete len:223 (+) Transcript_26366:2090-2758(+)